MVQERDTGTYGIITDAARITGPSAGADIIVVNTTKTAYITSTVLSADNATGVQVVVRDQDGSNEDAKRIYTVPSNDSILESGSVTEPIVKVPADKQVAIQAVDSVAGDVNASLTLQELSD
jgi:hypothetical protein